MGREKGIKQRNKKQNKRGKAEKDGAGKEKAQKNRIK